MENLTLNEYEVFINLVSGLLIDYINLQEEEGE